MKVFKVAQAVEMITDLKSWCWMTLLFLVTVPAGGITSFGPLILQGFGYDRLVQANSSFSNNPLKFS